MYGLTHERRSGVLRSAALYDGFREENPTGVKTENLDFQTNTRAHERQPHTNFARYTRYRTRARG